VRPPLAGAELPNPHSEAWKKEWGGQKFLTPRPPEIFARPLSWITSIIF